MKTIRFVSVLVCLLSPLFSYADSDAIKIAGGQRAGEYVNIASSLCSALGELFQCVPMETDGILDNKKLLENGEAQFVLAKGNIAEDWVKDEDFSSKYKIIRRIGDESIFVFGKPEVLKAVGSWIGVRENASLLTIGLPGESSGDTAVFNSLKSVPDSVLNNLKVKMYADRPALVEAVKAGEVRLGFLTQVPNPENALFSSINDAGLMMMGVIDPDMFRSDDTFRIKLVTVKNAKWFGLAGGAEQIETANVPVAIIAVKPESLKDRAAIAQKSAIEKIEKANEVDLLPEHAWMQELANNTTLKMGAGLDSVMTSLNEAAKGATERISKL